MKNLEKLLNSILCQKCIIFQKTLEKTLEFFGTETFETYEKTLEKKRSGLQTPRTKKPFQNRVCTQNHVKSWFRAIGNVVLYLGINYEVLGMHLDRLKNSHKKYWKKKSGLYTICLKRPSIRLYVSDGYAELGFLKISRKISKLKLLLKIFLLVRFQ